MTDKETARRVAAELLGLRWHVVEGLRLYRANAPQSEWQAAGIFKFEPHITVEEITEVVAFVEAWEESQKAAAGPTGGSGAKS